MTVEPLELRLVSALQRFQTLQRQATTHRDTGPLLTRALAELNAALEELRVAAERVAELRRRNEQLQAELRERDVKYFELFDEMPEPSLLTEPDTTIVEVNRAAVELLNVSQRYLVGKPLSIFVCEDRAGFLAESGRLVQSRQAAELPLKLRPRERAPLDLRARVRGDGTRLRWILQSPVANVCGANASRRAS